jgi:hypothetical protein
MFAYLHEKTQPYGEVKRVTINAKDIIKAAALNANTSAVTYVEGDTNIKKSIEVLESHNDITFWQSVTDVAAPGTLSPAVVNLTLAAAGSTQGAATALTKYLNIVTTSTAVSAIGVLLPTITADNVIIVRNDTAVDLSCFPGTGSKINGGTVNAAYTVPAYSVVSFYSKETTSLGWFTIK